MPQALLFVLSEPGDVSEREFHDWYDNEHGPARLDTPGIRTGRRYRAVDGGTPGWLAVYETDDVTLSSTAYRALRAHRSPREQDIVARLGALDRRTYELISDVGRAPVAAAPVLLATSLSTDHPDALDIWYREEHLPLLHSIDGWWRTRRYRLTSGDAPTYLALHELRGVEVFEAKAYHRAISTSRRERLMETVVRRERRVFAHHRDLEPSSGRE